MRSWSNDKGILGAIVGFFASLEFTLLNERNIFEPTSVIAMDGYISDELN